MNLPDMKEARTRTTDKTNYIYLNNNDKKIYDGKKYFIRTYGCQMNVHDSEEISARLENFICNILSQVV